MKRTTVLLAILSALAILPARAAIGPDRCKEDPNPCDTINFTVTMSDGVALEASLYVPKAAPPIGGYPLIVRQHGGGSNKDNDYDKGHALDAVKTGNFAALLYSHRGHGNSGGLFDFFGPRTTQDFTEVLDWVETNYGAKNNGPVDTNNVGVSGYSQGGGESFLPAENDPRVKAIAAGNTFASLNDALNPNDCFKASFAVGIFALAYTASAAKVDDTLPARWGGQLFTDTEDVGAPPLVPSTTDDLASRSPLTYLKRLKSMPGRPNPVPVFWAQGWEDQLFPGDQPAKILGPLEAAGAPVHYWFSSGGHAAGLDDPADLAAKEARIIEWFDQFLRGVDHGFTTGDKVEYAQRTGAGEPGSWKHKTALNWNAATNWPAGATAKTLFARSDGSLGKHHERHGTVVGRVVSDLATVNLANDAIANELGRQFDGGAKQVPAPTPPPSAQGAVREVPEDANPTAAVSFEEKTRTALEVTGAPEVRIPIRTTARRVVQMNAKLYDVSLDGSAALVNRGCFSLELAPGSGPRQTLEFQLRPNSHVFAAGHTLRLTLAAVDFPSFKPDTEPAVSAILAGARVTLPVM